jgi:GT2 family glycosyltransferase
MKQHSTSELITVLISTYNGSHKVPDLLMALQSQTSPARIVFVDDGSTDGVSDIIRNRRGSLNLIQVKLKRNSGISAARNRGLSEVITPFVAFCDDDCRPPSDWIARLEQFWLSANPEIVGVGGTVTPHVVNDFTTRYLSALQPIRPIDSQAYKRNLNRILRLFRKPKVPQYPHEVGSLVGANMSFRTSAIRDIGAFDEKIRFGGDEEDLCIRIHRAYGSDALAMVKDNIMLHEFGKTLRSQWVRDFRYGKAAGKRAVAVKSLPSFHLPLAIIVSVTLLVIAMTGNLLLSLFTLITGLYSSNYWLLQRRFQSWTYPVLKTTGDTANFIGVISGLSVQMLRKLLRR